jgi:hypothetical protein
MPFLHDPRTRVALTQRLATLRPDAQRRWGKMSVDQMLHHVNLLLESALGRSSIEPVTFPLPAFVMKFLILNAPWPKGSPTAPEWIVGGRHDFEAERARSLALIDEVVAKPVAGQWPKHANFGDVGGTYYSRLNAKHLDHHLKQFSA